MPQVALDRLGDVDREVADALEVGVDLDRRDDRAQVHRHRLVQRQQLEAAVVDFDVQLVDGTVAGEHARRPPARSRSTSACDGRAHAVLGEAAHFEQPRLELFELLLEVGWLHRHPVPDPNPSPSDLRVPIRPIIRTAR